MSLRMWMLPFALCATGCGAGWFMVGSTLHQGPPPAHVARYVASTCTDPATQLATPGDATASYVLANEGGQKVLYELDASGKGARIDNHWNDAEGDHFFTYVKGRQGWHYVLPPDRTKPAKRLILSSFVTDKGPGVMKPVGTVTMSCDLIASEVPRAPGGDAPAASAPTTTVATSPPPAVSGRPSSGLDTVLTKDGRVRGLIISETKTAGVKIKLPDGTFQEIPAAQIKTVEYADGSVSAFASPGPVTSAPPPAPSTAAAPPPPPMATAPPAPPPDPKLDAIYLKDGTILSGTIVSEEPFGIGLMFPDGHGRAIPAGSIARIVRARR